MDSGDQELQDSPLKVARVALSPDLTDVEFFLLGIIPIFLITLVTGGEQGSEVLKLLIQVQITIFGVFASLLLASLAGFDATRTAAQLFEAEKRAVLNH